GLGQTDALPEPSRQVAQDAVFDVRQPAPRDDLADGEPAPGTGHILELGPEPEILLDAHFLVKRHALRQVTDLAPDCQRLVQGVVPGQDGPPAGCGQVRRENAHRRRLPCSVGTKQADNLALSNAEADLVDGPDRPVLLRQPFHLDHRSNHLREPRALEDALPRIAARNSYCITRSCDRTVNDQPRSPCMMTCAIWRKISRGRPLRDSEPMHRVNRLTGHDQPELVPAIQTRTTR